VFISADYGKDGGGVMEAITKSGSNQLHGSLFELHRDAAFDAKTTSVWQIFRSHHSNRPTSV